MMELLICFSGGLLMDCFVTCEIDAIDVGWYILGGNQESLGPYTFLELCGKCSVLLSSLMYLCLFLL